MYEKDIEELTARAKKADPKSDGLNLGEKFFVELLHLYIGQYRQKEITAEELTAKKKLLERDYINYRDFAKIFEQHCEIRNKQGELLIRAEKDGCPICKEIVKLFDGRK
jgi:hypothetical protein